MSDPAYDLRLHPRAEKELANVTGQSGQTLVDRLHELKTHEQPSELNYVKQLEDHNGLYAVTVDGYRCLYTLDKPNILILLIDTRARVYDRLDVAKERGRLD